MQVVDPFIPVSKNRQPVNSGHQQIRHKSAGQARSVDGFLPKSRTGRYTPRQPVQAADRPLRHTAYSRTLSDLYVRPHAMPRPADATTSEQIHQATDHIMSRQFDQSQTDQTVRPRRSRIKRIGLVAGQVTILLILFGLGFLLRSLMLGQILILIYAVISIVRRIDSRTTFALALMSLFVVLIGTIRLDAALAAAFAVYAFLFLVIGTISLGREIRI